MGAVDPSSTPLATNGRGSPAACHVLSTKSARVVRSGGLTLDLERCGATLHDVALAVTSRESDLLLQFVRHPERPLRRSELLDLVPMSNKDFHVAMAAQRSDLIACVKAPGH